MSTSQDKKPNLIAIDKKDLKITLRSTKQKNASNL